MNQSLDLVKAELEEGLVKQVVSQSEEIVLVIPKDKYDQYFFGNFGVLQNFLASLASKYCLDVSAKDTYYDHNGGAEIKFTRDYDNPYYKVKMKELQEKNNQKLIN